MRLLHVSDIHFGRDIGNQLIVLRAFLDDVRAQHAHTPIDAVFFTGDLTFSGQSREFEGVTEELIAPLSDALAIPSADFGLVPGNHDVDRARVDQISETGLRQTLTSNTAVAEFLGDQGLYELYTRRLDNFRAFRHDLRPSRPDTGDWDSHLLRLPQTTVGVAELNTAWRATGGPEGVDRGQLLIGEGSARSALQAIGTSDLRVVLMHHPLDWLSTFDADEIRILLERHADIVLSGHMHKPDPIHVASLRGQTIYAQTGCLYQARGYLNGYTLIDVQPDKSLVNLSMRTYWPTRDEFDEATNVAEGGKLTLPLGHEGPGRKRSTELVEAAAYHVVSASLVEVIRETSVIGDRLPSTPSQTVNDLLVPPRLLSVPYAQTVARSDQPPDEGDDRIEVVEVLRDSPCLVIVGAEETGLTSALLWSLQQQFDVDNTRVPVYVNFNQLGAGKAPLDAAIRASLSRTGLEFGRRDDLPPLVVGLDDLSPSNSKRLQRVAGHVAQATGDLFLIGCRERDQHEIVDQLTKAGASVKRAFLGPFGRKELRHLVPKVADEPDSAIVDNLLSLLLRESLPRTPFLMAALMTVVSSEELRVETVSETIVLDRYVNLLIGWWSDLHGRSVEGFDFRNWEHVLAYLASELVRRDVASLPRLDAEALLVDYFRVHGWHESPGHVIDGLILRRVLIGDDRHIRFRHPAFRHLFAAKWMQEDEAFRTELLRDPLKHEQPIGHAAALKRNDRDLLVAVSAVAKALVEKHAGALTQGFFERMNPRSGWDDPADIETLSKRVHMSPVLEEELDEHLDEVWEGIEAAESAGEVEDEDTPLDILVRSVRLLSHALRNSELVPDASLKQDLLGLAMTGWSIVAASAAEEEEGTHHLAELLVEVAATTLDVEEGPNDSPLPDPRNPDLLEAMRGAVGLLLGVQTSMAIVGALGSQRLTLAVEAILRDEEFMEVVDNAVFATLLYSEMRGPGWVKSLKALHKRHGGPRLVHELIHGFAVYTYHSSGVTGSEAPEFENFIADLTLRDLDAPSGPGGAQQRALAKSNLLEQLRQSRRRITALERALAPGSNDSSPT